MIAGIASLVFIPLLAMAVAHFVWAFGGTWPVRDKHMLALAVTGNDTMPPRLRTLSVALLLAVSGIWALALSDPSQDVVLRIGGVIFAAIYLGRGIVGYLPQWRASHAGEPFAGFNRKLYSPLTLAIGLGFVFLTFWAYRPA